MNNSIWLLHLPKISMQGYRGTNLVGPNGLPGVFAASGTSAKSATMQQLLPPPKKFKIMFSKKTKKCSYGTIRP